MLYTASPGQLEVIVIMLKNLSAPELPLPFNFATFHLRRKP